MPILWSDDLSVNVKEIDDQHWTFLGILNGLYDVLRQPEREIELTGLVHQLESYAAFHFATEERYFDKFDYPWADEHKEEHRELLTKILKLKNRYESEGEAILPELLDFLENWLTDHLATQDKKYTKCLNDHGLF
ncbi:MAG TPA: bacteriohemerythrin [Patescibacteria group bacterium]|nr:bacteriohemerythrin [Patescibacteria group bacterium]